MMLWMALLIAKPAAAGTCDEQITALGEASPTQVAVKWLDVVQCDGEEAKAQFGDASERMLAGEDANRAMAAAIGLGLTEEVDGLIDALQSDQRSAAIASLGEKCKEDPAVEQYFVARHKGLGESFWEQRWYRGLADCRTDGIQSLLSDEVARVSAANIEDTTQFFSLLETYARNLGGQAIDPLTSLAKTITNEETLSYIVNSYADAAQVGSVDGIDLDTADKAVQAIVGLGPDLPTRAVMQARTTLQALGADRESDKFAAHRWRDRLGADGYSYAATAIELVTCKNGKTQAYFHHAPFTEAGNQWPEQIVPLLEDKLVFEWGLDAAERCKGSGESSFAMPSEPFADDDARDAWLTEQQQAFTQAASGTDKVQVLKQDAFTM